MFGIFIFFLLEFFSEIFHSADRCPQLRSGSVDRIDPVWIPYSGGNPKDADILSVKKVARSRWDRSAVPAEATLPPLRQSVTEKGCLRRSTPAILSPDTLSVAHRVSLVADGDFHNLVEVDVVRDDLLALLQALCFLLRARLA